MVSSINQAQSINSQTQVRQPAKTTKASIFYVNDVHSTLRNIEKLKTASDEFDAFVPSNKTDKLKLSAGDFCLGVNPKDVKYSVFAENTLGIMASAEGNHELDLTKKDLVDVLKSNNYKILGINLEIPQTNEENKELSKEITKSYIQEVNGTKYGIIGLAPFDFMLHAAHPKEYSDFNVYSLEKTIPILQKEVDNFKSQGIDKIIVLSHSGYNSDVQIAKSVDGIDVIIGGHTHDLIKGIEEGKNLFYSKNTGEPTIITQAGKNGNYFGVLNLEFDDKGIIKTAQNNVNETEQFPKSPIMNFFTDEFFGKSQVVGKINSVEKAEMSLVKENPTADFMCDAMKKELGTDIAIMNAANIRSQFEIGNTTDRDLAAMTPFKNEMCIVPLTEKELVDAIKIGAKSMTHPDSMPGLLFTSGLKYTLTKSGEIKSISFIDKQGKEVPIDIKNPNPFKTYRVGADAFVVRGGNGFLTDKTDMAEKKFDFDKDKLTADYIKKQNQPINIKTDGRITFVD